METTKTKELGGGFIVSDNATDNIFTPEDFNEEQRMIKATLADFVTNDLNPVADRMEHGEYELNRELLSKLGELGILGTHMPEKYGGMQMDTNTNTVILEGVGPTGAFSTTFGAHTGIGMLPILYFGTEAQKEKYLPGLISAELVASYCLTEPSSGSDALAAKTRADLSEDGEHYILNGQKMWITNAGFADIFIVFAKLNGEEFSAFIVEKGTPGLTLAAEEKKLGIKGSSTRQVFFENVTIPKENLLGEIGQGHKIAFNALNAGRFKIGPFAVGGAKGLAEVAIKYANERHQFGQSIGSFGAVKAMIANMVIQTYVNESAVYRTSGLIHEHVHQLMNDGKSYAEAELEAAEEFAIESSILKIAASENVNFVADRCVQVHGGMGYSEETKAARGYRDSRISMIYEGTNEINRMLILNMLFKRAMRRKLDILTPATAVQQEVLGEYEARDESMSDSQWATHQYRKLALMLIGTAGQLTLKGKINLKTEQEILMGLADILIALFLAESTVLRNIKNENRTDDKTKQVTEAIEKAFLQEANTEIRTKALEVVGIMIRPEKQASFIEAINHFCSYPLQNQRDLKRFIADHVLEADEYNL